MSKHDSHNKEKEKDREEIVIEFDRGAKADDAAADPPSRKQSGELSEAPAAEQVARLLAEKDELMQTLVRRQADFENYRKRVERDRLEEGRRGVGRLIQDLLPVLDAFERALGAHDDPAFEEYQKGLELIYRQMWDALTRHGLERINAAGKQFDPHFHEALDRVETREHPDGAIVEVLRDGFMFHGRVLRPSSVRVAAAPENAGGDESSAARQRAS